jgi:hypothetical protein
MCKLTSKLTHPDHNWDIIQMIDTSAKDSVKENPDMLTSMDNFAPALDGQGEDDEAKEMDP